MSEPRRLSPVRAVVFDVGGVLCPSPTDEFSKVDTEYRLPPGTVQSFLRGGSLFAECEVGRLPIADFFDRVVTEISVTHDVRVPAARLDAMLAACMGDSTRVDMLELLRELKASGYQTGLLTNIFAERRRWLHETFPPALIDVYADSSALGLRKPEPPIYHRLLELLGRRANEVAFIDDFSENLGPARELGMVAILFADAAQVRAALAAAGVALLPGRRLLRCARPA